MTHRRLHYCVLLLPLLVAGCASHADRLREVCNHFYAGELDTTATTLDNNIKKYGREAECFKLDRAIVDLVSGRPQDAEKLLREVRDSLDHNQQASLAESAGSMVTDDTVTAYAGEDYERVLIRAFLAISNLMHGGDDARAYALQTTDLQEQIIQSGEDESGKNLKLAYKRVALGAYIDGMLREQNPMDAADAARSWVKVCSWEPDFPFGQADVERAVHGHHSRRGNGVLYVFTLVGRGPFKQEKEETGATIAMLLGDRILSYTGKQTLPPTIAMIKVPKVVASYNTTNGVQVSVDGQSAGSTATITDVTQIATQQYEALYPQILGRAVARRIAKKGIVYGVKEATNVTKGSALGLVGDVVGVVWEASEVADCRCWGLLPNQIQVLRIEMPAGDHRSASAPSAVTACSRPARPPSASPTAATPTSWPTSSTANSSARSSPATGRRTRGTRHLLPPSLPLPPTGAGAIHATSVLSWGTLFWFGAILRGRRDRSRRAACVWARRWGRPVHATNSHLDAAADVTSRICQRLPFCALRVDELVIVYKLVMQTAICVRAVTQQCFGLLGWFLRRDSQRAACAFFSDKEKRCGELTVILPALFVDLGKRALPGRREFELFVFAEFCFDAIESAVFNPPHLHAKRFEGVKPLAIGRLDLDIDQIDTLAFSPGQQVTRRLVPGRILEEIRGRIRKPSRVQVQEAVRWGFVEGTDGPIHFALTDDHVRADRESPSRPLRRFGGKRS